MRRGVADESEEKEKEEQWLIGGKGWQMKVKTERWTKVKTEQQTKVKIGRWTATKFWNLWSNYLKENKEKKKMNNALRMARGDRWKWRLDNGQRWRSNDKDQIVDNDARF